MWLWAVGCDDREGGFAEERKKQTHTHTVCLQIFVKSKFDRVHAFHYAFSRCSGCAVYINTIRTYARANRPRTAQTTSAQCRQMCVRVSDERCELIFNFRTAWRKYDPNLERTTMLCHFGNLMKIRRVPRQCFAALLLMATGAIEYGNHCV